MSSILSSEHSARVTNWDDNRRQRQSAKKLSNWMKLVGFVGFNMVVWGLFLSPVFLH